MPRPEAADALDPTHHHGGGIQGTPNPNPNIDPNPNPNPNPYKSISTRVLVSVNGVLAEASDPGPAFAYYLDEDFRIERIYPRGGPVAGGTNVTVTGFAFADLDDGQGLACQF